MHLPVGEGGRGFHTSRYKFPLIPPIPHHSIFRWVPLEFGANAERLGVVLGLFTQLGRIHSQGRASGPAWQRVLEITAVPFSGFSEQLPWVLTRARAHIHTRARTHMHTYPRARVCMPTHIHAATWAFPSEPPLTETSLPCSNERLL